MKISAVIITKNEERNIGRCLEGLQEVADEVIVVDTFSEDRTQEICESYGARFITKEWLGYSATKNFANDLAQFPYILSLDADEALSDELRSSILEVKERLEGVYSFNRLAIYCGKPIRRAGWYPDRKIRLFPKEGAKWEGPYVHEELVPNPGQKETWLKGDLLHYTYYTIDEHRERARKYAKLAAEKLKSKGKGTLFLKGVFSPVWRFLQMYFIRLGFLEGWRGYRISMITAKEVAWKYWGAFSRSQSKQ